MNNDAVNSNLSAADMFRQVQQEYNSNNGMEYIRKLLEVLQLAEEENENLFVIEVLTNLLTVYQRNGDSGMAVFYAEKLRRMSADIQDNILRARCCRFYAAHLHYTAQYAEAYSYFQQGLGWLEKETIQSPEKTLEQASLRTSFGALLCHIGKPQEAVQIMLPAVEILESIQHQSNRFAGLLQNLANAYAMYHDYEQAIATIKKSLAIFEELNDNVGVARCKSNIATMLIHCCDYFSALEYFYEAIRIFDQEGELRSLALALSNMGRIYTTLEEYPQAVELYKRAAQIQEQLGNNYSILLNKANLASVYLRKGEHQKSKNICLAILPLAEEIGNSELLIQIKTEYVASLMASEEVGDMVKAVELFSELLSSSAIDDKRRAFVRMLRAKAASTSGWSGFDTAFAEKELLKIEQEYAEAQYIFELRDCCWNLACLYKKELQWQQYALYLEKIVELDKDIRNDKIKNKALLFYNEQQRQLQEREKEISDSLLQNMFPVAVAEKIKNGMKTVAERFQDITVIFCDIVNFTSLASNISAPELVTHLDAIFAAIDEIATEYGIEKIKTIGDAYMAIVGAHSHHERHTLQAARFAFAVQARVFSVQNNPIKFRIGMHCGEVVGGIIGRHRLAYDVWGDAVNVASRIESLSSAGKILISESVKNALVQYPETKDECRFTNPEMREIKGKGSIITYYLEPLS